MLPGLRSFPGGDAAYPALGVLFDGTNDYLSRGADFNGNFDGKRATISFWVRRNGGTGSLQYFYAETTISRGHFEFLASNAFRVLFGDTGGSTRLNMSSSVTITDTTTWHHIMCSFDLADATKRHLYVDDVSALSVTTYNNNNVDFTQGDHTIGADAGANKLNADLAEFYYSHLYTDLSLEANRRKFISASKRPVDLGSDGSIPSGVRPMVFLRVRPGGAAVDFVTNNGSGGGMTLTGALTLSATNP